MDSTETPQQYISQLKEKLSHLQGEVNDRSRILSSLMAERNKLLKSISQDAVNQSADETLPHYSYILPLVKEIHILELKIKEKQKEYENRTIQREVTRLGHAVLADSFHEEECVLKQWSKELSDLSVKGKSCTEAAVPSANIIYHACVDNMLLMENLAFTVLCSGVHVRLKLMSETKCSNIHMHLRPASARIGVSSDTYIPKLEETVLDAISQGRHVSEIVSLIAQYIADDMAPYVIAIPMKKKAVKDKEVKSKNLKSLQSK